MTETLKEILKRIKGEIHLSRILNSKIRNPFITRDFSLFDIYQLEDAIFIKMEGNGIGKLKYFHEFKKQVNEQPSYFEHYETYVLNSPIVIGDNINANKSLVLHIQDCLLELFNALHFKSKLPIEFFDKIEFNSYLPLSNYIDDYFGLTHTNRLTFKEIGAKYNKSSEIIRINLFENKNRADLCKLFNNVSDYGVVINKNLTEKIRTTLNNNLYNDTIFSILTNDETIDVTLVKRLMEIFKFELIETNFENSDAGFYSLVRKDETLLYRAHITIIDSIFRDNECLTKEQLVYQIEQSKSSIHKRIITEKGINMAMLDTLLANYYKVESIQDEDAIYYQFKWHYLCSLSHKITRILMENGTSMSKEEILNEYNSRATDLNVELIESTEELHIKKTNKIKPIGKLGRWFYSENEDGELKEPIAKFIDKSIAVKFKGKITFTQLKDYISNSEYALYPESNLRTNIFLCCRRSIDDDDLFIHQDFLSVYPEIKTIEKRNRYLANALINAIVKIIKSSHDSIIEKNELKNKTLEILKNEGFVIIRSNHYYTYLNNFTAIGILIKKELDDSLFYALDEEELKNHDLSKLGKKSEPEYKKNIRSQAISFLKENKKAKLSDLKVELSSFMPKDISYSNFYRIFQDRSIFIKEQTGSETWISLETSLLPVPQELHVEVQEEANELLGNTVLTERVRYELPKLKLAIIEELVSENAIYKMNKETLSASFDIFYTALSGQNGVVSKWGDSLLQSLYELLCTKTDYYDRETCLNKLITGYETYLKCYISNSEYISFTGQADVINYFSKISELRYYKDIDKNYRTDTQKTNFSYILSRIKYLSDVSRHDKMHESLDMGFNRQIKNAIDFIALYLYSGYLIKKM